MFQFLSASSGCSHFLQIFSSPKKLWISSSSCVDTHSPRSILNDYKIMLKLVNRIKHSSSDSDPYLLSTSRLLSTNRERHSTDKVRTPFFKTARGAIYRFPVFHCSDYYYCITYFPLALSRLVITVLSFYDYSTVNGSCKCLKKICEAYIKMHV